MASLSKKCACIGNFPKNFQGFLIQIYFGKGFSQWKHFILEKKFILAVVPNENRIAEFRIQIFFAMFC